MCCRSLSMYARAHVICSHQYTCIYCPCPHPLHTHTATPPPSTRSDLQLRLFGPHATHPDQPFRQPRRRLTPLVRFLFLVICMVCACACAPPLPPTHTRTRAHRHESCFVSSSGVREGSLRLCGEERVAERERELRRDGVPNLPVARDDAPRELVRVREACSRTRIQRQYIGGGWGVGGGACHTLQTMGWELGEISCVRSRRLYYIHIYICIYTHTHIYIYMYIYVYIYVMSLSLYLGCEHSHGWRECATRLGG